MRTLLTKKQRQQWLHDNFRKAVITHKWSCRGYGNSKLYSGFDSEFEQLEAKRGGCGYDRFGAALGDLISSYFPQEVYKLAKRTCKGKRRTYKSSGEFYGLFFNSVKDEAWLDGACGESCMLRVLEKIGFKLNYIRSIDNGQTGCTIYTITAE